MENAKKFDVARFARLVAIILGVIVIILGVFAAGVAVGFSKAKFSYEWGDNYHRVFGGPRRGWMPPPSNLPGMRGDDFINPAGAAGMVIKVTTDTVYINGSDHVEKNVIVDSGTVIRKGRTDIQITDLKVDDRVVVVGAPSTSGQIEAKLIRVFDR